MSKINYVLVIFVFLFIFSCKTVFIWESKGPFEISGCIKHLIIDPLEPKRLYAGAENGGLWVLEDYTNSNLSWRPLTDQLENLQSRGLAKSDFDTSYIVYGNGLGHVFHSFDNGKNWSKLCDNNFSYIRKIIITTGLTRIPAGNYTRLAKQTKVLIGSKEGLFRVELINDNFSKIDTLLRKDILDLQKSALGDDILYAGVRREGLLKTENSGHQWDTIFAWNTARDTTSEMIKVAISGSRLVAKFGNKIFRNENYGSGTWTDISPVFDDEGGSDIGYRGNYSRLRGEWHHCLAVSPVNNDVILAGQTDLAITSNAGTNWNVFESGIGHEDVQSIVISPAGDRFFIANDGGVFEVRLDGTNTKSLNKGLCTMQFYRVGVNGNNAVGNADHQGIKGTQNLNSPTPVWSTATPSNNGYGNNGLENDFVYADIKNQNRFFVLFQSRDILRLNFPATTTSDLLVFSDTLPLLRPFMTYTNRDNSIYNQLNYGVNTFAIDPRPNSNTMLASAHTILNNSYEVKITRNGNRNPTGGPANNCSDNNLNTICFTNPVTNFSNWNTSFNANAIPVVSIEFSKTNEGKVFLLNEAGSVFKKNEVNNNNEPWNNIGNFNVLNGDFARQIITDAFDSSKLYALAHKQFYRSNDGGIIWEVKGTTSLPNVKYNSICVHPTKSNNLFLATDTTVYISKNSGDSWEVFGNGLPNAPIMQIYCLDNYLYTVTFGRGLWRCNLLGKNKKNLFVKGS